MNRKLLLLLALTTLSGAVHAERYRCQDANGYYAFSDKPCGPAGATEDASAQQQANSSPAGEAYTKDMPAMRSPDPATQACFSHVNTTARFPDPSTTRLLSGTRKWVAVKDVGGRQMVSIGVTSKNEAGMYIGVQFFDCLLMGDNLTVNTGAYELLEPSD
ncbi:MAG: DUF4124 domain-containing protein [Nitrosomonadales bacterium]|nr:DUF4124 domain-containing protein [Nitrosomonadales bacterium]